MNTWTIALYLHLIAVVAAFSANAIIHANLGLLSRATSTTDALAALGATAKIAIRMPLFALGLFLTGAWLTSQRWPWSTPFLDIGIMGLVVMVALGGAVLRPRMMALRAALMAAPAGPLNQDCNVALRNPVLWTTAHLQPALALGIMFNMVMKPSMMWGLTYLLTFMVVGALTAVPHCRNRSVMATRPV